MATWKSILPMVFKMDYWQPGDYDVTYETTTFTWEYQTTADVLSIIQTNSRSTNQNLMGPDHAEAQLKVLANWYATYEGKDSLRVLLKEELEE